MKRFVLVTDATKRDCLEFIRSIQIAGHLPAYKVEISEIKNKRSLEQNAKMWAMLKDIAAQVDWYGQKLTREDWKDMFSAALKQFRVVPGVNGGFVSIGAHTSKMSVQEMSDLIELITAFGIEHRVRFSANPNQEIK